MRIIFNGFQLPHIRPVMEAVLRETAPAFCATIDDQDGPIATSLPVVRHDYLKLKWGEYDIPAEGLRPLDESLLVSMSECETLALRMMDRLDPTRWSGSYEARKQLYLTHLRYWNDFIERHQIDHLLLTNIPHEVHDFILFELCRLRGINTWMFCQSPIPDTTFLLDDWRGAPAGLAAACLRLEAQPPGGGAEVRLPEHVEQHFRAQVQSDPVPFYMPKVRRDLDLLQRRRYALHRANKRIRFLAQEGSRLWRREARQRVVEQVTRFFANRPLLAADRRLSADYQSRVAAIDLGARYIYIPLHFQPECTTSPMGGAFVDQSLMVAQLAAAAPDLLLYVKEHPVQRSWGRAADFYARLARHPQVRFVDTSTSSFELIRYSWAVATVTGTAGWEALFRGKPVLMFGHFFYGYAPAVFRVSSAADAERAVNAIERGARPTLAALRLFLRAVTEVAVDAYSDAAYAGVSRLSPPENAANLSAALLARLGAIPLVGTA